MTATTTASIKAKCFVLLLGTSQATVVIPIVAGNTTYARMRQIARSSNIGHVQTKSSVGLTTKLICLTTALRLLLGWILILMGISYKEIFANTLYKGQQLVKTEIN